MAYRGGRRNRLLPLFGIATAGLILIPAAAGSGVTATLTRSYSAPFPGTSALYESNYSFGCGKTSYAFLGSATFNLSSGVGHMGSRGSASNVGSSGCASGTNYTASNGSSEISYVSKGIRLTGAHSVKITWTAAWTFRANVMGQIVGFADVYPVAFLANSTAWLSVTAGGDYFLLYNQ
ncbi:MAG TPA: hypothetical protein VFG07_10220, partial [Thermoplasmata archaeon]|nr:hypothetical protein [Thermoplasmata archaeon]